MAANATLNLALDRTSGRFSAAEGTTRLYVYDAAIDLSVGGWTRDEVAIGQDGKTIYEPYFQIVCGGMVLAEAKLNGVENPEEGQDEYFMTGTLSTNTVQMAAMFCGCAASETMRQFEARIFSTTSANPIATGRVSVWSFPSGGSNPANLPSASEALAALRTDLDNHTENEDIHVTAQEKAAWTGKQNALTFDSAPTEGSQNPVTSGGVKAALDAEAQARAQNDTALGNAIAAEADTRHTADNELGEGIAEERNRAEGEENRIQGDLNTHKENFTIHVTATDKAAWNAKVDPATLLGYVNGGAYDSETRRILFKHDNNTVAWIDATPFILDGMVNSAYITPDGAYLVITFNTDSGKQPISIPLTDIFNPANYYDKTAVNNLLSGKQDVLTFDNAPTSGSNNPVKSGGIWSAIWGVLSALPTGFTSLYDWCVAQLAGKANLSNGKVSTSELPDATTSAKGIVQLDTALTTSGKAADAKATGDALAARPTKAAMDEGWWSDWTVKREGVDVTVPQPYWQELEPGVFGWVPTLSHIDGDTVDTDVCSIDEDATSMEWLASNEESNSILYTATRHRVAAPVPTKPEDIGAQDALSAQQLANIAAVPNKANASDLPYAISESMPLTVTGGAASTTLNDRTHNVRTVAAPGTGNTTTITATLPPIVAGKSRDMFLNLTVGTQASDAGDISLSIVEQSGATVQIDIGSVEDIGIGKNEILISENALPTTSGNITTTHWLVTVRHEDFAS